MKKYSDIEGMSENARITVKTQIYSRTATGKGWKAKPDSVDCEKFAPRNLRYFVDSKPIFRSRTWGKYTKYGYLPYKDVCVSPDGTTKVVTLFEYK